MTNRASSRLDWLYTPAGLRAQTSSWRIGPTRACTRARPGPRTRSLREADPSPPATLAGARWQADRGRPVATMAALALRLPGGPHAQGTGTDAATEGRQPAAEGASVRARARRHACGSRLVNATSLSAPRRRRKAALTGLAPSSGGTVPRRARQNGPGSPTLGERRVPQKPRNGRAAEPSRIDEPRASPPPERIGLRKGGPPIDPFKVDPPENNLFRRKMQ